MNSLGVCSFDNEKEPHTESGIIDKEQLNISDDKCGESSECNNSQKICSEEGCISCFKMSFISHVRSRNWSMNN
jgi:hypothetical protein